MLRALSRYSAASSRMTASDASSPRNIIIIGGGIIGLTTAYYLSHHASFDKTRDSITLLEASEIACAASGKAGGLLALWAYPECIVPLSFRLHRELAETHNGASRWGYRALHCGSIDIKLTTSSLSSPQTTPLKNLPPDLTWLHAPSVTAYSPIGTPATTAQVHPHQFTTSMASLAQEKGVKILYGTARAIQRDSGGAVAGVVYSPRKDDGNIDSNDTEEEKDKVLPAATALLTAGPWTPTLYPPTPISAIRAHSISMRPEGPVSAHALFTSITLPSSSPDSKKISKTQTATATATPEIYPRPNAEVYACSDADQDIPLPDSALDVQVDAARIQALEKQVGAVSAALREGVVTGRRACYLPTVDAGAGGGGGPLVGETSVRGLLVGAGHSCWGIQNAPGTGLCLSELVWEGRVRSADLAALDPRRFGM